MPSPTVGGLAPLRRNFATAASNFKKSAPDQYNYCAHLRSLNGRLSLRSVRTERRGSSAITTFYLITLHSKLIRLIDINDQDGAYRCVIKLCRPLCSWNEQEDRVSIVTGMIG